MAAPDHGPVPADPLGAVLAGTASWYQRRFRMRNCRVAGGRAVHAVRQVTWLGGNQVPAPACHVGIGGWDLSALEPSTQRVSCQRCLRLVPSDDGTQSGPATSPVQLPLY